MIETNQALERANREAAEAREAAQKAQTDAQKAHQLTLANEKIQQELAMTRDHAGKLQQQLEEQKAQLASTKTNLDQALSEQRKVNDDLNKLKAARDNEAVQLVQLTASFAQAGKDVGALTKQIDDARQVSANLTKELNAAKGERDVNAARAQSNESLVKELNAQLELSKSSLASSTRALDDLRHGFDRANNELSQERSKVSSLEQEVRNAMLQITSRDDAAVKARTEAKHKEEKLQTDLSAAEDRARKLQRSLEDAQKAIQETHQSSQKQLEGAVEDAQKKLKSTEEARDKAEAALKLEQKKLNVEIASLKDQLVVHLYALDHGLLV